MYSHVPRLFSTYVTYPTMTIRVDPLHWHSAEDSWLGLPLISMVLLTEINTNLCIHLPELAGP